MPLKSIRKHGSWGDNNPSFQTFFHNMSDDVVVLDSIIANSEESYEGIIEEHTDSLIDLYGADELSKESASVQIYD